MNTMNNITMTKTPDGLLTRMQGLNQELGDIFNITVRLVGDVCGPKEVLVPDGGNAILRLEAMLDMAESTTACILDQVRAIDAKFNSTPCVWTTANTGPSV